MIYSKLPSDLAELKPYFADLQKDKPKNPEYDTWKKMYEDDSRPYPTTFEDMWMFFGEHMYVPQPEGKEIKIVADPKKLTERVKAMVCYMNSEVPEMPKSISGQKRSSCGDAVRYCPRCEDSDTDVPNILEPRQQYCNQCKKY